MSRRLRYDIRMEPGVFDPDETLVRGHGSCRDFAWLEVALLYERGQIAGAAIYIIASVVLAVGALFLGLAIVRLLL